MVYSALLGSFSNTKILNRKYLLLTLSEWMLISNINCILKVNRLIKCYLNVFKRLYTYYYIHTNLGRRQNVYPFLLYGVYYFDLIPVQYKNSFNKLHKSVVIAVNYILIISGVIHIKEVALNVYQF